MSRLGCHHGGHGDDERPGRGGGPAEEGTAASPASSFRRLKMSRTQRQSEVRQSVGSLFMVAMFFIFAGAFVFNFHRAERFC